MRLALQNLVGERQRLGEGETEYDRADSAEQFPHESDTASRCGAIVGVDDEAGHRRERSAEPGADHHGEGVIEPPGDDDPEEE